MPMSFDGLAANTSGWSIGPRARGTGSIGCAARIQHSLPIGHYATATAEHREPYESRGSRTVLGAPEGESPSGDSSKPEVPARRVDVCFAPMSGHRQAAPACPFRAKPGSRRPLLKRANHSELTLLGCYPFKWIRVLKRCQMNEVPTLVTSCINCVSPSSLSATLAVILIGAGIAWTAERRNPARVRSDK